MTYLFVAYTTVWLGLFVYLRRLARRSQELAEEINELRRMLER